MYTFNLDGDDNEQQIALIRDEIDDVSASPDVDGGVEGVDYFLSDERIKSRIASVTSTVHTRTAKGAILLLAAASILDTLATNQAYVLKKQRTLEQDTDGPAVAASIRAHAKALRERAAAIPDEGDEDGSAGRVRRPMGGSVMVRTVF